MGLGFTKEVDRPVAPMSLIHMDNVIDLTDKMYSKTEVDALLGEKK